MKETATLVAKFIPNWNCHYGVSQQTELTQSKTPPTAVTDSIMLSKGTWSIKAICAWFKKKAIVYDFFKKLLWIIKIVWKWIHWLWMARFRILDQTSHSHVQFRKRRVIHVHWTGNGPEWGRCFVGINFLRGKNHIVRPKSPKYMFTERLSISLAYSSFGFKLGVFPTYNSE